MGHKWWSKARAFACVRQRQATTTRHGATVAGYHKLVGLLLLALERPRGHNAAGARGSSSSSIEALSSSSSSRYSGRGELLLAVHWLATRACVISQSESRCPTTTVSMLSTLCVKGLGVVCIRVRAWMTTQKRERKKSLARPPPPSTLLGGPGPCQNSSRYSRRHKATRSDAFVSIHSAWFLLSFLFLRLYCVCCVCGCVCCTPATASLRLSSFFSSFPHSTARLLATAAAYLFVSLAAAPAVSSALGKPPANEHHHHHRLVVSSSSPLLLPYMYNQKAESSAFLLYRGEKEIRMPHISLGRV
jgi:hypothetical protein